MEKEPKVKSSFRRKSQPNEPLVSVITVCLNSQEHLEQAIKSVIEQSYDNIEYIIVDGGSSDGTLDIIRRYENETAYWVSEPDREIYDAINKGISHSTGEIVGIINSDDWYEPHAVQVVVEEWLKHRDAKVIYGNMMNVTETPQKTFYLESKPNIQLMKKQMGIYHPSCFITRDIYRREKYDLKFRLAADYALLLKLYLRGVKFHYVNRVLAYFRAGGASFSYRIYKENYIIRKEPLGMRKAAFLFLEDTNYFLKRFLLHTVLKDDMDHVLLQFYYKYIKRRKNARS